VKDDIGSLMIAKLENGYRNGGRLLLIWVLKQRKRGGGLIFN